MSYIDDPDYQEYLANKGRQTTKLDVPAEVYENYVSGAVNKPDNEHEVAGFRFHLGVYIGTIIVFVVSLSLMLAANSDRDWRFRYIVEGASGWSTDANGRDWSMPMASIMIMTTVVVLLFSTFGWRYFSYAWSGWLPKNKIDDITNAGQFKFRHEYADSAERGRLLFLFKGAMDLALFIMLAHVTNTNQVGNVVFGGMAVLLASFCTSILRIDTTWLFTVPVFFTNVAPWLWCAINLHTEKRSGLNQAAFWVSAGWELVLSLVMLKANTLGCRHWLFSPMVDEPLQHENDRAARASQTGWEAIPCIVGSRMTNGVLLVFYLVLAGAVGGPALAKMGNTDGTISWQVGDVTEFNHRYPVGQVSFFAPTLIMAVAHLFNLMVLKYKFDDSWLQKKAIRHNDGLQRPYQFQIYWFALAESVFFLGVAAMAGISEVFEVMNMIVVIIQAAIIATSIQTKMTNEKGQIIQRGTEISVCVWQMFATVAPYAYAAATAYTKRENFTGVALNESTDFQLTMLVLMGRIFVLAADWIFSKSCMNSRENGGTCNREDMQGTGTAMRYGAQFLYLAGFTLGMYLGSALM